MKPNQLLRTTSIMSIQNDIESVNSRESDVKIDVSTEVRKVIQEYGNLQNINKRKSSSIALNNIGEKLSPKMNTQQKRARYSKKYTESYGNFLFGVNL